jgi:hypothetical protein
MICLFSDGPAPLGSSPLLDRTRREATDVPTSTVGDGHCHSCVLAEFTVAAIENFLSEFERLDRE